MEGDKPKWFYKDPRGVEHGPFTDDNMRLWFNQNYFKPDLLVRPETTPNYLPLAQLNPAFTKPLPLSGSQPEPETPQQPQQPKQPEEPPEKVVPRKRKQEDVQFAEPAPKKVKAKPVEPVKPVEEQWIYLDNSKNIQGPFPTSTMRNWHKSGALHDTLPIKLFVPGMTSLTDKTCFVALKDYVRCTFTLPEQELIKEDILQTPGVSKLIRKPKKKKKKIPNKWYYRDPEGTERGPYSLGLIRQWYNKQYIPPDTAIRGEGEKQFAPMQQRRTIFEDKELAILRKKNQSLWTYIDDDGRIQGPFEKYVLKSWHDFGWLPYDIRVRRVGETYYIPWGDRMKIFENDSDEETEERKKQNQVELEKLRPKENQDQWWYKDDGGKIQGPFTSDAMKGWFEDGFFFSRTEVKKGENGKFIALKDYKPRPDWCSDHIKFPDEPAPSTMIQPMMFQGMMSPFMMGMAPRPPVQPKPASMWFYMAAGDKAVGPYPFTQIQTWHREGYFNDRVKVSRAETPDKWQLIIDTECAWKAHHAITRAPMPMPLNPNRNMRLPFMQQNMVMQQNMPRQVQAKAPGQVNPTTKAALNAKPTPRSRTSAVDSVPPGTTPREQGGKDKPRGKPAAAAQPKEEIPSDPKQAEEKPANLAQDAASATVEKSTTQKAAAPSQARPAAPQLAGPMKMNVGSQLPLQIGGGQVNAANPMKLNMAARFNPAQVNRLNLTSQLNLSRPGQMSLPNLAGGLNMPAQQLNMAAVQMNLLQMQRLAQMRKLPGMQIPAGIPNVVPLQPSSLSIQATQTGNPRPSPAEKEISTKTAKS